MMQARIKGFDTIRKKLQGLPAKLTNDIGNAAKKGAIRIVAQAKKNAPADTGRLRSSISWEQLDGLSIRISVHSAHAPYVEFGTGKYVDVPAELQDYAAQFKGKKGGGDFDEMVRYILAWMKRKGIKPGPQEQEYDAESGATIITKPKRVSRAKRESELQGLAWVIAAKLLREGMRPQPFFYPAFFQERPKILAEIQAIIKKAI